MSFLISKYKGIYRLQTEYDQSTKQFPRNLSGTFEDLDIYIKCRHDVRIYHYGKGLLEAYIPSIQRGMNIIRTIYRDYINKSNTETTITYMARGNKLIERENIKIIDEQLFYSQLKDGIISNFYKTDSEILFRFHYKYMKEIEARDKVKVLLAQALFGNPDVLLLDEPTNDLDLKSINWLQEFLINFENTVIVVSHDRYFLNKVCTHIADVDFGKIKVYPGNYDFWYESSQLALKQMKEQNKKKEEKIKELQDFIARFSANASKSKQATSRKKTLEKIELDEIKPSNRKYPYVDFKPDREPGKEILQVKNISKTINGEKILDNISFTVKTGDKIAFLADNENAKTVLFQIIAGEMEPDEGELIWGTTITKSYFPKDNNYLFDVDENLTEWLRKYSKDPDETYVRGFLGRMLFSGDESLKQARVISGGEKVRCVLAKMMLSGANFLIFDEPTNHLDMESITSVNDGMSKFKGNILFTSHDHQLTQTVANRIIDIKADKVIDREVTYNEYLGIE